MQLLKINSCVIALVLMSSLNSMAGHIPTRRWTITVTISGNTTICSGSQIALSANVFNNGTGTLSYVWKKNGSPVTGIMGPPPNVLVYSPVSNGDVFTCVATSTTSGTATSNSLTATVNPPQTFTVSCGPNNINFCQGAAVTFTAFSSFSITGYQWSMNGNIVSGATSSTFNTTASSVTQLKSVSLTATSNSSCISNTSASANASNIPFTVATPTTPTVTVSASPSGSVCPGSSVTFTATPGSGIISPTYQWSMNGTTVSGATNNTFTTTVASLTQLHSVAVAMTSTVSCISPTTANGNASGISFSVITPLVPSVTIAANPSGSVCAGTPITFTPTPVNGGTAPGYQWQLNGSPISGANGSSYSSSTLTAGQQISVLMTSNASCISPTTGTSPAITIALNPNVTTPAVPSGPTLFPQGSTSTYTTSGGNATSYNWSISPAAAGTISATGVATWSNYYQGTATVNASSNGCNGPSGISSLAVTVYPKLISGALVPGVVTIAPGSSPGGLTVNPATGGNCGGSYHYQWQSSTNGNTWSNIADMTNYFSPGNLPATVYYRVQVTCGTDIAYSNTATITVGTVSSDMNFIRERDLTRPGVTDSLTAAGLTSPFDVQQTTRYFDGLGRPIQTVAMQASPLLKDIVGVQVYDPFGNESQQYLPYVSPANDGNFKTDPLGEQSNFNSAQFPGEQYYYAQIGYESSPLNRVMNTSASGLNWVGGGRGTTNQYNINETGDSVQIWNITATSGALPTDAGIYPAGQLYKNISADEQGHQTVEYKDKTGHVVMKKVQLSATPGTAHAGWLCTYYVYDDRENLRFAISPRAVELINGAWTISQGIADELCYRYEYDPQRRVIARKIPGAGEIRMVYDARDRLVLSQDSVIRSQQKWMYLRYDGLNRVDSTGFISDPANYNNPAYHQNLATASISYPNLASYTSELLTATYYDDYSQISAAAPALGSSLATNYTGNSNYFITSYNSSPLYALPVTALPITRGMETGKRVEVQGSSGSQYLYTVNFYDDRGRMIQTRSVNYTGGVDTLTTQYDFSGKPLRILTNHQKNGIAPNTAQNHQVLTKMSYDAGFRLKSIYKNIDGAATDQLIDSMQYNELGQLRAKYLGNGLDSLVYDYNIRGWVTGINKNYVRGTSNNFFGIELGYDKTGSIIGTTGYLYPVFNGNVAGTVWRSAGDGVARKYDFAYDNVNRLTSAAYLDNKTGSWGATAMDFSVSGLSYDANGNILSMNQHGFKVGTPGATIDSLLYSYQTASNKLLQVVDAANDSSTVLGDFHYKPAGKGPTDYSYDGNGNQVLDNNKAIDLIVYNYLNQPQRVHMKGEGDILYTYDAGGNKLKKVTMDSASRHSTTILYMDDFVYQQTDTITSPGGGVDTLQFLIHEEGRTRWAYHKYLKAPAAWGWEYDFFEKDQLGNPRILLSQEHDTAQYLASMEAAFRNTENALFYNIPATSYPRASAPGYPVDVSVTNPNDSVIRVNGSGQKVGPAIILKVMSGDKVDIGANYYYNSSGASNGQSVAVTDIINSLANSIVNLTGPGHGSVGTLTGALSPLNLSLSNFITDKNGTSSGKPNAYLNWIFLDNQLNFDSTDGISRALQVGASGTTAGGTLQTPLGQTGIQIKKSGYLYIYVSNATPGWDVFFDNLSVTTYAGPVLEENHYYPFGLTMAGISDKAIKPSYSENKYRFNKGTELQNKEFRDGNGLELYETEFRNYDPQIGRFSSMDLLSATAPDQSPYSFATNNPERFIDPLGLDTTTTTVVNGHIQIKANPQEGDVLKIVNKDGSASYYTYDPGSKDANQQGYVGAGVQSTEPTVTVTGHGGNHSGVPPWLAIAMQEANAGIRRNADGTNNPRILEYLRSVDPKVNSEKTAWCAGFVNWVLKKAGIAGDKSLYAMDFSTKKWGKELDRPALGAIVVFDHHVGFVVGINYDGRLVVLGGNQGPAPNGVDIGTRSPDDVLDHGYRYPEGYTPNYELPKYHIDGHIITYKNTR